MITLIAVLHALPVLIAGFLSKRRSPAVFAAVVMVLAGMLTGNPAYMAVDVFAVGLALAICIASNEGRGAIESKSDVDVRPSKPAQKSFKQSIGRFQDDTAPGHDSVGRSWTPYFWSEYRKKLDEYGVRLTVFPLELHRLICNTYQASAESFEGFQDRTIDEQRDFIDNRAENAAILTAVTTTGLTSQSELLIVENHRWANAVMNLHTLAVDSLTENPPIEIRLLREIDDAGCMNELFRDFFWGQVAKSRQSRQEDLKHSQKLAELRARVEKSRMTK
jgi:hypothetical protein